MKLKLQIKPFSFQLLKELKTSQGIIRKKKGWLISLESESNKLGWGEIAPFKASEHVQSKQILLELGNSTSREILEQGIKKWPGAVGFGIGSALAEIDCLIGDNSGQGWMHPCSSAILLPTQDHLLLHALDITLLKNQNSQKKLTFKWKAATDTNKVEWELLKAILSRLPNHTKLRIDANGGWNREQANQWAKKLHGEPRLEWLEQPLPAEDIEGLMQLAKKIPIALDESLMQNPSLRETWQSWQIRRPSLEGDPRNLLKKLNGENSFLVISTAFETGIGSRWIKHLAALQQQSITPTQPGLAPGWCPNSKLFSSDPYEVWEAV